MHSDNEDNAINPDLDSQLESLVFHISPLIRITLLSLYVALTLPLPFLAKFTHAEVSQELLVTGLGFGLILLYAALSEQVVLDRQTIKVTYPVWVPKLFWKGWCLNWSDIKALKPRVTGQGGIVYYFLSNSDQAYLLPMRVSGFAMLTKQVEVRTNIDTSDVRSLAQPWMYIILLFFTFLLLLTDAWTISNALGTFGGAIATSI